MLDINYCISNSELYFSRKGLDLFISAILLISESVELKKHIGLGFDYTILRVEGCNHYLIPKNRESELVEILKGIFDRNPQFFNKEVEIINSIYNNYFTYLSNFKNRTLENIKQRFDSDLFKISNDLMHTTSMPYLVLKLVETNPEKYTDLYDLFSPLRAKSLYQDINTDILKIWLSVVSDEKILASEQIELLLPTEISNYFNGKNGDWENFMIDENNRPFVIKYNEKERFNVSFETEELVNFFINNENLEHINSFNGNIAFHGKVRGVVKVVNSKNDELDFKQGYILVSINTNPSIINSIKKCAAIITDEGGITCHAAIVSRELGIPCIIGTKIATKVLKDGDLVEVDADSGVVRILERSNKN